MFWWIFQVRLLLCSWCCMADDFDRVTDVAAGCEVAGRESPVTLARRLSTYLSEVSGSQLFRFCSFTSLRCCSVQPDRADAILVTRIIAPAFGLSLPGLLIERFSCRQYRHIFTAATLTWCYKLKATMMVFDGVARYTT